MKGGVNESRDAFDATYYGEEASAKAVVIDRAVQNKGAVELVKVLSQRGASGLVLMAGQS